LKVINNYKQIYFIYIYFILLYVYIFVIENLKKTLDTKISSIYEIFFENYAIKKKLNVRVCVCVCVCFVKGIYHPNSD